ncbi:MAG: carboxypeptidase regulatory-like domain-containing protein [Terracidiphilus sp.]
MSHRIAQCVLALLAVAGLAFTGICANAQSSVSGSISGTVTDATGAVIPGAAVTITNTDRGEDILVIKTNSAGFFTAESLPLGNYKVTISSEHFKTEVVAGIVLHAADELTVNRALTPGGASEVVTVNASDLLVNVNLQDATSAGQINSEQMNEMPLVTRNYEMLMNLQPGVTYGGATDDLTRGPSGLSGASSVVSFSVNGGRTTSNGWTIDGADNLDRGANLTLYTYPSPDAIAEFKTLRGQYSAQFGRNASGQIDVVTKSGSNSVHGSAYEYVRNNDFDANGYANDFLGVKIPPYKYNVFGFSLGGPVYIPKVYHGQNKTFFFISEEWQRIIDTLSQATATVPLPSEIQGDFSQSYSYNPTSKTWTQAPVTVCTAFTTNTATQTNTCTATGTKVTNLSPTAQQYLKDVYSKIPAPVPSYDIAHDYDPHTIFSNFKNIFNNLDSVVRIDQQFGQRVNVFYRYMHDTFPVFYPAGQFTAVYIPGMNPTTAKNPGTQQMAHGTYIFSPSMSLDVGYAFSNGNITTLSSGYLSQAQSPDVKPSLAYPNTSGVLPTIGVSGMTSMGGSYQYIDHGTNHQVFGNLTKTLHTHTLIFGFSYNHYQKRENNTTSTQGSFGFTNDSTLACTAPSCSFAAPSDSSSAISQGFANFLTGNANNGFSQLSNDPIADIKSALYEGFAQDNWKLYPRLTLNLGVRYSLYGQPWDANGLLSTLDPATYSASKAPTIDSNGLMCVTGTCTQAGSNAGQPTTPNPNADIVGINYINGLIFNGPSAANNNQASPWGNKVGVGDKKNFAPRIGFDLDVFGDGKTALRGGYGIAYDDPEVSYYETSDWNDPPAVATYSVGQTSLDSPTGGASTAFSKVPGWIRAVPIRYNSPYVQQFSLDVQRELSPSFMLDVGYFGDHGTHLLGALDINEPMPGSWVGKVAPVSTCIDPDTGAPAFLNASCSVMLNQIKPYLGYFSVDAMRSIFNSNYNSLQAKVTKRFKGKTYIDANYTWSRDLTNAQADYSGFIQNAYNINGDYGRAAVDRGQVLTIDGVLEEPWFREQKGLTGRALGGWEISGIYTANSGLPLTASSGSFTLGQYNLPGGSTSVYNNRTNTGYSTDNAGISVLGNTNAGLRPDQIGNPNAGNNVKIHNKGYHALWFYTGAFASPNPSTNTSMPGSERRGTIQGPGFGKVDFGVYRNFRIWERVNFQFRAEAFNATNHTNVQGVTTSEGTLFGEVTSYRDARIMQFAGKITF